MSEKDFVILGGGLAALSTAYFAKKKGFVPTILEKTDRLGGLLRTEKIDNFYFDVGGSHIIFSKNQRLVDFIVNEILDGCTITHKRDARIFYKGNFIRYPFENGIFMLSQEERLEILLDFIKARINVEKGVRPTNFKEFLTLGFGKALAQKYLIPYNEKIWKTPLEDIELDWVGRLPNPGIEAVVKSAMGIPTEGYIHQSVFHYPKTGGIESLAHNLISKAKPEIKVNSEVKKISVENSKIYIEYSSESIKANKAVSTIPLNILVDILNPTPPREVQEAARNLKWTSLITVAVVVKGTAPPYHWIYVPNKEIIFHRLSFPSNYYNSGSKGYFTILVEISSFKNKLPWSLSNEKIEQRVRNDLEKIGILKQEDIITTKTFRFTYGYPIYTKDWKENRDLILNYLATQKILATGRFGSWQYINMDKTIELAQKTVDAL